MGAATKARETAIRALDKATSDVNAAQKNAAKDASLKYTVTDAKGALDSAKINYDDAASKLGQAKNAYKLYKTKVEARHQAQKEAALAEKQREAGESVAQQQAL